jgi:hypothetical protein
MAFTMVEFIFTPTFDIIKILLVEVGIDFVLWRLAGSYIEANTELVRVNVPYGTFAIRWPEITTIIVNGPLIAFTGNDKRVVVSLAFAGAHTNEFIELVKEQANKYKIEIRSLQPGETIPITHQNSRDWNWENNKWI